MMSTHKRTLTERHTEYNNTNTMCRWAWLDKKHPSSNGNSLPVQIQQMALRSDNVMLEGRQVKICAACFEISICLLRVLEMVATVAPALFTDKSRPSSELFLKRIMQVSFCLSFSFKKVGWGGRGVVND